MTEDKEVNIGKIGEIDLPKIDVSKYIGQKAKIATVTTHKSALYEGYYIKIQSEVVETIGKGEKAIDLKASRIFGLQEDEKGKVGYGKDTKLGVFLTKMKCKEPKELIGKTIVLQSQTSKDGTEFLSFN